MDAMTQKKPQQMLIPLDFPPYVAEMAFCCINKAQFRNDDSSGVEFWIWRLPELSLKFPVRP